MCLLLTDGRCSKVGLFYKDSNGDSKFVVTVGRLKLFGDDRQLRFDCTVFVSISVEENFYTLVLKAFYYKLRPFFSIYCRTFLSLKGTFSEYLLHLSQPVLSIMKMQRTGENASLNGMWQLG